MDIATVLAKTAKGAEAVSQRAHGLDRKARQVLIVIDGKRRLGDLPRLVEPSELLDIAGRLLAEGLVETADPVNPDVGTEVDVAKVRLFMVNTASHFLGVFGSSLIERIERCTTASELLGCRAEWQRAIAGSSGGKTQIADLDAELAELLGH